MDVSTLMVLASMSMAPLVAAQTVRGDVSLASARRVAAGDTLEQGGIGISGGGRLILGRLHVDALLVRTLQASRPTLTEVDLHGQLAIYGPLTAGLGVTARHISPDSLGESVRAVFVGLGIRTNVTRAGRISGSASIIPLADFAGGGTLVTVGGGTVRGIDLRLDIELFLAGDWLSAVGRYAFQRSDRDRNDRREGISYEYVLIGASVVF